VQGFATNIANKTYISGQTYGPAYFLGRPRQYGVRISRNF
jgi:hypothetical protein